MKMASRKLITAGAGIILAGAVAYWLLFKRKGYMEVLPSNNPGGVIYSSNQLNPTPAGVPSKSDLQSESNLQEVFKVLIRKYGKAIAQNVERIFRWETGHFKSAQYLATGSAGMTTGSTAFPYGWKSLENFWTANPASKPVGIVGFNVEGKQYNYLAFPGAGGFFALAEVLRSRDNNAGRWNSNVQADIDRYNQALTGIRLRFTA